MKRKKWGKTHIETLNIFLKNFSSEFKAKIKNEVLNDNYLLNLNQVEFHYSLNKKYNIPAIGSSAIRYWTHRGWSKEEAENKRKKIKIGNKSPMRIEYWLKKGYSEAEANIKIKTRRKLNKEYWLIRGYDEESAIQKVKEFQINQGYKAIKRTNKLRITNPEKFDNKIEYWIAKGYSEEEAKLKLKERQQTFTKEKLISKYGKDDGLRRWSERQKNWKAKVFNDKQWLGGGVSKVSNNLFEKVIKELNLSENEYLTGLKNEKYISNSNMHYKYDFTYLPTKKIIEFHGDYWHCNPKLYESTYYHKIKNMTAHEIWAYDKAKKELAESKGYKVLEIWENDYCKNPEREFKKCLEFIKN